MRPIALAFTALLPALISCSYDTGTGALAIGPDTYTMSKRYAPIGANLDTAENETLADANRYCAQAGRQFVALSKDPTSGSANPYGPTYFTLTFRCVAPADLGAATYQQQQPTPSQPPGQ